MGVYVGRDQRIWCTQTFANSVQFGSGACGQLGGDGGGYSQPSYDTTTPVNNDQSGVGQSHDNYQYYEPASENSEPVYHDTGSYQQSHNTGPSNIGGVGGIQNLFANMFHAF